MSDTVSSAISASVSITVDPFPSAGALRAAHNALLNREEDSTHSPEFLAEVEVFIRRGRATGVLLDADIERAAAQSVLNYWKATLYAAGHRAPSATLAKFDPTLLPNPTKDKESPYVGLNAFQETDHAYFFGRERAVADMLDRLKESAFLAVVGSSGSGKSSLVLAGLLPALKNGALAGSQHWRYLGPMVPGSDPLRNLAKAATTHELPSDAVLDGLKQRLGEDPKTLCNLIDEEGTAPVIMVIDQFEEIFTLINDETERQAFSNNLSHLVAAPDLRNRVIVTMRSDKRGQLVKLPSLLPLFRKSQVEAEELDASELRETILEPADRVGLKFEEGIVEALVKEIIGEPAGLPLLQFALLKLWNSREHSRVTWEAYRRLGGARKALGRSADEFYEGLLPDQQAVAKRIILRLVHAGRGLEGDRNRVLRRSLLSVGNIDIVERVLHKLAAANLVRVIAATRGASSAEDQFEVAHEALIRNWEKLSGWLQDEQVTIRQREQLTEFAENWNRKGKHDDDLLRGSFLYEAKLYAENNCDDLNELEKEFIQASNEEVESTARRQIEQAEERAEAHRVLAVQAQKLAQEEKQRAEDQKKRAEAQSLLTNEARKLAQEKIRWAKLLRFAVIGISFLTLVIAGLAFWVNKRRQTLDRRYHESHSRELAGDAVARLEQPDLSISLALKAVYLTVKENKILPEARSALDLATQASSATVSSLSVSTLNAKPNAIVFSWDGRRAVSVDSDKAIRIWEARQKTPLVNNLIDARPTNTPPLTPAISGIGVYVQAERGGKSPYQGSLPSSRIKKDDASPPCSDSNLSRRAVNQVLSEPGMVEPENKATLLEAAYLSNTRTLVGQNNSIVSPAISQDGNYLVSIGSNGDRTATIWKLTPKVGCRWHVLASESNVLAVALSSPETHMVATGSADGIVRLWDVNTGRNLVTLGGKSRVQAVTFSPDGELVAAGSYDGTTKVWEVNSGKEVLSKKEHQLPIYAVAFSRSGNNFATASVDGVVVLWDARSLRTLKALTEQDPLGFVPYLAFSEKGERLALARGTFLHVWDVRTGQQLKIPTASRDSMIALAMSPDGTQLLTASTGGIVSVHALDDAVRRAWTFHARAFTTKECKEIVQDITDQTCNDFYSDSGFKRYVAGLTPD